MIISNLAILSTMSTKLVCNFYDTFPRKLK